MTSQVLSTIQLMDDGQVVHTIKTDDVIEYDFTYDSKELSTLHLVISNLYMRDLNTLVMKPYDSYVLMGVKRIIENGKQQTFEIPPRVFKHATIKENGNLIDIVFKEKA